MAPRLPWFPSKGAMTFLIHPNGDERVFGHGYHRPRLAALGPRQNWRFRPLYAPASDGLEDIEPVRPKAEVSENSRATGWTSPDHGR